LHNSNYVKACNDFCSIAFDRIIDARNCGKKQAAHEYSVLDLTLLRTI